jgi:SAM-dependent methyltransferase
VHGTGQGWQAEGMPEMPPAARAFLTSGPYRFIARRIVLPWVLQGEHPAGEGLEIGAGGGAMAARLLAAYPELRMTATDYDDSLLRSAEQTLAPFGDRASVQRADAADLPFGDNRFDLVLSAAMLHHVVAWEKALAEAVRVLRPGGLLTGYDMLDSPLSRLLHIGRGHDIRMVRWGQMDAALGRLPVTGTRVRPGPAALVVRFAARKAS